MQTSQGAPGRQARLRVWRAARKRGIMKPPVARPGINIAQTGPPEWAAALILGIASYDDVHTDRIYALRRVHRDTLAFAEEGWDLAHALLIMIQLLGMDTPIQNLITENRSDSDSDAFYLRGKSDRQEWRDGYVYIPADRQCPDEPL